MRHVCGGDYYFGPRDIHRDLQSLSSVPLLEMEAQPLKDVEKAGICLQVMQSALWLISWRGRPAATVTCHGHSKDRATLSTQGVIVYMGPKYEKF
jgi:hypothetical protein